MSPSEYFWFFLPGKNWHQYGRKRGEMVSGLSVREAAVLGLLPRLAEVVCDGVALNSQLVHLQSASAAQSRLQPAPCCWQTEFHCCEVKGIIPSPLLVPRMELRQPWAGDGGLFCPSVSCHPWAFPFQQRCSPSWTAVPGEGP